MAMKLNKIKRWLPIRQYLGQKWNVNVYFSNRHVNYYSAWLYTTKEDKEFLQSSNHPDLLNSRPPKTMSASEARVKRRRVETGYPSKDSTSGEEEGVEGQEEGGSSASRQSARRSAKRRRSQRLSSFEVSTIIVSKQIKTRSELLALASAQKAEGKTDLAEFIVNRGTKVVEEVIATAWEMENASEVLERSKLSRVEILDGGCSVPNNCSHGTTFP